MPDYPKQIREVEINPTKDGFIIHDNELDRVHYLNHTGALVLGLCTGANSTERIIELVQNQFDLETPPNKDVAEILSNFVDEALIEFGD